MKSNAPFVQKFEIICKHVNTVMLILITSFDHRIVVDSAIFFPLIIS